MSETDELTRLQQLERKALTFPDRETISWIINSIRVYRAAAKALLGARYRDGECDAVELHRFAAGCARAEEADEE